jgi:hypothetical protein
MLESADNDEDLRVVEEDSEAESNDTAGSNDIDEGITDSMFRAACSISFAILCTNEYQFI